MEVYVNYRGKYKTAIDILLKFIIYATVVPTADFVRYKDFGCDDKSLIAAFVMASCHIFILMVEIVGHKFIESIHKLAGYRQTMKILVNIDFQKVELRLFDNGTIKTGYVKTAYDKAMSRLETAIPQTEI